MASLSCAGDGLPYAGNCCNRPFTDQISPASITGNKDDSHSDGTQPRQERVKASR